MPIKITELRTSTTITGNDFIQIIDRDDPEMGITGTNKKILASNAANQLAELITSVPTIVQNSLLTKANLASPTFTGNVVLPSTTEIGSVTATEIGYLDGVTGPIQSQLATRAPLASPAFTGAISTTGNISTTRSASDYNAITLTNTSGVITNLVANANSAGNVGTVSNHPFLLTTNNTERMRISDDGNVGIGATSGGEQLRVQKSSGADSDGEVLFTDGTRSIRINSNTSSGSYNSIVSAGDQTLIFTNGTIGTGSLSIAPWAASTSGIKITSTGNVGIGKTTPSTALDVNGTITATAFSGPLTGAVTGTASGNIRQGGGASQTNSTVYIGWSAGNKLRLQVDVTDFASTWPIDISGNAATATSATSVADAGVTAPKLSGAQTGSAPIYGIRAWAKLNPYVGTVRTGAYKTGNYVAANGTTVTVTIANHGLKAGDKIRLVFTKVTGVGTVPSSSTTFDVVSRIDANSFTVTFNSTGSSGNVTAEYVAIQGSGNISSASFYDSGGSRILLNFAVPMPHANYCTQVTNQLYPGSWWATGAEDTLGTTQLNTVNQVHVGDNQNSRFLNVLVVG